MLNLFLPHERDVVSVEGNVQAKLGDELKALSVGRHAKEIYKLQSYESLSRRLRFSRLGQERTFSISDLRGPAQWCSNLNDAKSDAVSCCAAFARARMTRRIDAPPLNALAIAYKSRGENLVPCPIA